MNTKNLSRLLADAKSSLGLSYEALSAACGGSPSDKRLHQLINQPLKNFPDPETLSALSRGTGIGVTQLVLAAARSLNLDVQDDDPDSLHIAGASQMPPKVLDAYVLLGRELGSEAREQEVVGNDVHPAPIAQLHPKVPADYEQLAANKARNRGAELDAKYQDLGEESQDHEGD